MLVALHLNSQQCFHCCGAAAAAAELLELIVPFLPEVSGHKCIAIGLVGRCHVTVCFLAVLILTMMFTAGNIGDTAVCLHIVHTSFYSKFSC